MYNNFYIYIMVLVQTKIEEQMIRIEELEKMLSILIIIVIYFYRR